MVGTTDKKKSFHPFGIAICTNERNQDFEFIFKSIKTCAKQFDNFYYEPDTLIADAADATTIGFKSAFGENSLKKE